MSRAMRFAYADPPYLRQGAKRYGDLHNADEIPADWPTTEAIAPSCDLLCAIHQEDLAA